MRRGVSLLDAIGGLLSRTYDIRHGLEDLAPFVIGDVGFRRLYAGADSQVGAAAAGAEGHGARTLVRDHRDGLRAAIYFPDPMIRLLESHPPQRGLGSVNLSAFATLVEEIDHLLLIAERARLGRPVTMLELELHANVSKFLVAARFLADRDGALALERREWLLDELFERPTYVDADRGVRERYRSAARYAVQFLRGLRHRSPEARLHRLRRFHDGNTRLKLRMAEATA